MNQDQVKELLIKIEEPLEEFNVLFTGKTSKKVDGFYRPDERTIFIHNRNMETEQEIIYCAIHEYAHHIHVTSSSLPISNRCHTNEFRSIFHKLLKKAEEKNLFNNHFKTDQEFINLTKKLKEEFIEPNANLMKDFGQALIKAYNLCQAKNLSFEDYITRELALGMSLTKQIISISQSDIDTSIGFENMKIVAKAKNTEEQKQIEQAFQSGISPDIVKQDFLTPTRKKEMSIEQELQKEIQRIERTIESLQKKLVLVENELETISKKNEEF